MVDGRLIENLHVDDARRVLAWADAIAERATHRLTLRRQAHGETDREGRGRYWRSVRHGMALDSYRTWGTRFYRRTTSASWLSRRRACRSQKPVRSPISNSTYLHPHLRPCGLSAATGLCPSKNEAGGIRRPKSPHGTWRDRHRCGGLASELSDGEPWWVVTVWQDRPRAAATPRVPSSGEKARGA